MALIPRASLFIKNAPPPSNKHSYKLYDIHGYLAFSNSDCPLSNRAGIVYYHRYVASLKMGRWLRSAEDAHHIDENPRNNHWNNFKVMSRSEHILHHRNKLRPKKAAYYNRCQSCKKLFLYNHITQKYCSSECAHNNTKRANLTRSELIKLLRQNNLTEIGRMFNVSCNAVKNWCKKYQIFYC